jgi:transposase-like protein
MMIMDVVNPRKAAPDSVAGQLIEQARAEGVSLVGPGGALQSLIKQVLETALEAELEEHLGYEHSDRVGKATGNERNGTRSKTVATEVGSCHD